MPEIHTLGDLDRASPKQRRAYYRELLEQWERNAQLEAMDDAQRDHDRFLDGLSDSSPIDTWKYGP
jgi:hypothetical protein